MSEVSFLSQAKRLLVGARIPSHLAHHERFSKVTGLAVLSSDPLSSVAYATEEILRVLTMGGIAALSLVTPIGAVIAAMLAVVVFSYRQTIHAYPNGGGAYIVAKENLGRLPSLVAAAALLIDYVLTVAVSIAAGVAAITSAIPAWHLNTVEVSLSFVAVLAIGNLRGVRESGRLFAAPTYFFIASIFAMLGVGAWRYFAGSLAPMPAPADALPLGSGGVEALGLFVILTAFSNGCTAMTGVEAVSNGVPAFRPPESRNAAATLVAMAVMSIAMFMGITLLAHAYGIVPSATETVVSQIARGTFGAGSALYYAVQAATMLILVLAANTAYADFPRLASIVARDRFLPRQFMNQGDRLAFSNGIVILSLLAGVLLVVFGGDTHALIPLYMIGVFVSFTLSQSGMVVHWWRLRTGGWRSSAAINGFGAAVTGIVLLIVATTKAFEGAWIVLVMIPTLVLIFTVTRRHYDQVAAELTLRDWQPEVAGHHTVVVPIGGIQRAVVKALQYARTLSADVRAVYVDIDPAATASLRQQWDQWGQAVELVVLPSPYRSLMEPLLGYLDEVQAASPNGYVTVILPEFLPRRLWHHLLHNQHALLIKGALLFKPNVIVTSVPFHLGRRATTAAALAFVVLGSAAGASAEQAPPAEPAWQWGGFADVGALFDLTDPESTVFRGRGTTWHLGGPNLNMAGISAKRIASPSSRWGTELMVQAGKDTELFGFSATAPNLSGHEWLRHIGLANLSYLAPAGNGLTVQAGIFASLIGYDSLYARDNANYTRPWSADFTPFLMMGANATYPLSPRITLTGFVTNGYWHLADANDAPNGGAQLAFQLSPRLLIKETILAGPHQANTSPSLWRVLSDTIVERRTPRAVMALEWQVATERLDTPAGDRAWWLAAQAPMQWLPSGPWSVALRPELVWDSAGRWTLARQTVSALTTTLQYRASLPRATAQLRLEHRVDVSRGPDGGFRRDDGGRKAAQHLLVVALIASWRS